jgi:N-acetylglutamate synthase-like GNAT family acetyltransferase
MAYPQEPEGSLVGCMGLERRGTNVYIQSMSVAVDHRLQGISRLLVDYAYDNYVGHGDRLVALTLFWNKKVYEKLGFELADARQIKNADDVGAKQKHKYCMALVKEKCAQ